MSAIPPTGPYRMTLPNRRENRSAHIVWKDDGVEHAMTLSVGFDFYGRVKELFATGDKIRNSRKAEIDDALVGWSLGLQCGMSIAILANSLGREGIDPTSPAASVLGLIALEAAKLEIEEGPAVASYSDRMAG